MDTDYSHSGPTVRPSSQAGRFYESDADLLRRDVDGFLSRHSGTACSPTVRALIVPHAGYIFSGNVAAAAYMALDPKKVYQRIFLIGPSHYEWLDGASVDAAAHYYTTPLGQIGVDRATVDQLLTADDVFTYREAAHDREHCLEVQLPFLQRRMGQVPPIVPIILSTNRYQKLQRIAELLKPYFNDDNLFVISSDFSHYPSYEDACTIDGKTGDAIASGDVERLIATLEENSRSGVRNLSTSACGAFAIITLLLMTDSRHTIQHLLYQNSGDLDRRDHRRVVGYHAFAVLEKEENNRGFSLNDDEKKQLKRLAYESISTAFSGRSDTDGLPRSYNGQLQQKCGAFVTLTKQGRLRGCIGRFGDEEPLYSVVTQMARAAAFEDPRFPRLRPEELDEIEIEISVLTPMRRIHSIDEFQLHKHGLYIRKGYRSGTYLPKVADEVNWTKEEFVAHCSHDKAGLGWDGWRTAELYVYEAIVF